MITRQWYYLVIIALLGPVIGTAQNTALDKFIQQFRNQESATSLQLSGWGLQLASRKTQNEDAQRLLNRITGLRMLSLKEGQTIARPQLKDLLSNLHTDHYEDLAVFRDGDNMVQFLIRENTSGMITDLLMLINGEDNFLLLNLEGELRFSDLNDLDLEFEGAENLKRLPEKRGDLKRV
ncbi:MAG: DUF4252 domain-containing protein [Lewinellaceae bacterium]|nr:DUF4252 domain-containing protein [Lewinellaceae bacterium]